jgi:hypothetical protein
MHEAVSIDVTKQIVKTLSCKHHHVTNATTALTLPLVPLFCPTSTRRDMLAPNENTNSMSLLTTVQSLQQPTPIYVQH